MSQYGSSSTLQSRPMHSPTMTSTMNSRTLPGAPGLPRPGEGPSAILPPPRPSSQASTDSDRRSSRTFASVHSILNPTGEEEESRGRRRSAAQMELDSQISPTLPPISSARPPSSGGLSIDKSPPGFQGSRANAPRRILTPISPTLHRTNSLSRMITGTIDAQSTPFLANPNDSSRPPSTEPASAGLPTLPPFLGSGSSRQSFSHLQAPTPPLQNVPRRKSVSVLPSARASPSPSSYSSYSRSGQASPSLAYPPSSGPTPPGPLSLNGSPVIGPIHPLSPNSLDSEGHHLQGIPVVSGGQNQYEYFNIHTGKGLVQVPVEVQVASRQADEKRKRNAGASARFRQRRKEKEREANATIDRLREELRAATEDSEYYMSERDRYIDIIKQSPGWERHLPRTPSPRVKRRALSSQTASNSGITSGGVSPTSPFPPHSELHHPSEMERNTRRRIDTENYQPSNHQEVTQQSYPSPHPQFSPRHAPQHPAQHPGMHPGTHSHHLPMVEQNHAPNSGYERQWPSH